MYRYLIILLFIITSFCLCDEQIVYIDLITTNDIHGGIGKQDANFMNPEFPPTIIGGAGYYKYIKDNINDIIDYVWHLAARGEVWFCRDNPEEALDVNVIGTLNILKQAKRLRAKHIFFADTSAEYDSFEDDQYFQTAEWMSRLRSPYKRD